MVNVGLHNTIPYCLFTRSKKLTSCHPLLEIALKHFHLHLNNLFVTFYEDVQTKETLNSIKYLRSQVKKNMYYKLMRIINAYNLYTFYTIQIYCCGNYTKIKDKT